jgi:hypothetical protein
VYISNNALFNPQPKVAVEAGLIVCFADDLIARVKSILKAEKIIRGLENNKI